MSGTLYVYYVEILHTWALTIHKRQGLALPKAWIDIGKSERTAGVS
jgi:ATP-dependent exoDNAse (exonuclease V) alpha subunit